MILGWYHVLRRTLKYIEVLSLFRNLRDDLYSRRAGPDHADPLVCQIDAIGRPTIGVVLLSGKPLNPAYLWRKPFRKSTDCAYEVPGRNRGVLRREKQPLVLILVKTSLVDTRSKLDIPAEVKPVSDVVQVALYFRLAGIPLCPIPLLVEFFGERVRVVPTLDVAPGTRVTVPIPRSAYTLTLFISLDRKPDLAKPIDRVKTSDPGPYYNSIELFVSHDDKRSPSLSQQLEAKGDQPSFTYQLGVASIRFQTGRSPASVTRSIRRLS